MRKCRGYVYVFEELYGCKQLNGKMSLFLKLGVWESEGFLNFQIDVGVAFLFYFLMMSDRIKVRGGRDGI